MATGLLALLDDVVAIAKVAAASVDDIAAQATKAGAKAAGVVVDDAAVTPRYVVGFEARRELAIIWKIAVGSAKNKLIYLLPAALFLNWAAPWAVTPLLMLGGAYLCYEGAEKVLNALKPKSAGKSTHEAASSATTPQELEAQKVAGAIRTDFILSAEIMAITLAAIPPGSFLMQAAVLASVGLGITVAVYGVVALIVKADDVGVALAANEQPAASLFGLRDPGEGQGRLDRALSRVTRPFGRGLVHAMPVFLHVLSVLGVIAMAWVGGGILLHGLHEYGFHQAGHVIESVVHAVSRALPWFGSVTGWSVTAIASALFGLAAGAIIAPLAHLAAPAARRLAKFVKPAAAGR